MRTEFRLDGCYTLVIDTEIPRLSEDRRSVLIQVDYEPIPVPPSPVRKETSFACPLCGEGPLTSVGWSGDSLTGSRQDYACAVCDFRGPLGRRPVFASTLQPSHARAIASVLLSAATEART